MRRTTVPGRRVLMLLENNPYPQDVRVRQEARTLTKAGYQVSVVCPAAPGQPRTETLEGVGVYRYPSPPEGTTTVGYVIEYVVSLLAAAVLTLRVAVRPGFDIIHAHNPPDTFVLLAALFKPFGKRFVFDHHDLSPEMYVARFGTNTGFAYRIVRFLERLSFRLADLVLSTNESYRAIALARGGVDPARVVVVRNGPDLDRVRLHAPDEDLRARAPFIIGYAGTMGPQDGVDYLLRALHHLKVSIGRDDFFAVLAGAGDALPGLRKLAGELGLEDHVLFTGHVSDAGQLMKYLSTADIAVSPDPSNAYNDRSTMIKITEYLALGKPVVAFDLPEHRVTAGEAARYALPNDPADLAAKLAELMDDPGRRKQMGELGQERTRDLLSWERQEPHLLNAYERVAHPGTRRGGHHG